MEILSPYAIGIQIGKGFSSWNRIRMLFVEKLKKYVHAKLFQE